MSVYPKQLQKFDQVSYATGPGGSKVRSTSFESHVVLTNGLTPVMDYTVNALLRFIEEDYTNYITTIDYTKSEDRFRPFDTSFGDTVVFPSGVALVGDKPAGELIDIMRVLYDNERTKDANRTGLATSVLN